MESSVPVTKIRMCRLDSSHSELSFKVKHMMIGTVTGYFKKFNVTVLTEGDDFLRPVGVELMADVDSLDTNNTQRDDHLKSEDFFHIGQHDKLLFNSTKCELDDAEGTSYNRSRWICSRG